MQQDVRIIRFTCDRCGNQEEFKRVGYTYPARPVGWSTRITYGHGLTNHSQDEDICSGCTAALGGIL